MRKQCPKALENRIVLWGASIIMVEQLLLSIIKSEFNDSTPPDSPDSWDGLISYAQKQGLLPYIYSYIHKLSTTSKPSQQLLDSITQSHLSDLACHIQQSYAVDELRSALEQNHINNLFFKGSVTKNRYNNPLLRTMGDIDVLYKSEQDKLFKSVMKSLHYSDPFEGRKNDKYVRKPFICVEAHRQLVASDSSYFDYCSRVWERAGVLDGCMYSYIMTPEDELIFHMIHLAAHFAQGGAGIRFIIDAYVYNQLPLDNPYLEGELEKIGLLSFYKNISVLADNWFSERGSEPTSESINSLASFILTGSTFGTRERSAALAVENGRFRYLLHACFPSYKEMVSMFPWLGGKVILLPYAWLLRAIRSLRYRRGNVQSVLAKAQKKEDSVDGAEIKRLYREWGL